MRRISIVLAALVALSLVAAPVSAAPFPMRIALPNGWSPEGITSGPGLTAYVGSLADGAVAKVDLRTGSLSPFIAGATGRVAVGVEYEAAANRLWVAGGPTGEVRAYDAATGALLETYTFPAGFINDLVVTGHAVYATDSAIQQLLVVPLGDDGSLPAPADAFTVAITGDFIYVAGFNANGIVALAGWLIVPNSTTGQLFALNPATGESVEILPAGSVTAADGLELVGSTLYIVRNQLDQVDVYSIRGGLVVFQRTITSPDLDIPTTTAFAAGQLWTVNARFSTPASPDTEYWITRLPTR